MHTSSTIEVLPGGSAANGGSSQQRPRRIQISVRADGLKNVASRLRLGKLSRVPDPYALLSVTGGPRDGTRIGRTETVRNNLSPDWCRIFIIDYWTPGMYFPITISLYDDNTPKNKSDHMMATPSASAQQSAPVRPGPKDGGMGEATFELSDVLSSPGNERSVEIQSYGGRISIHAVDSLQVESGSSGMTAGASSSLFASSSISSHAPSSSQHSSQGGGSMTAPSPPPPPSLGSTMKLQMRGLDMKNVEGGLLGLNRSDCYFSLEKKLIDHSSGITRWKPIYRSNHIKDSLNPYWDAFYVDAEMLCNLDLDWPLRIVVLDHDKKSRHKEVGSVEVTPSAMMRQKSADGNNADRDNAFQLNNGAGRICVLAADIVGGPIGIGIGIPINL